VRKKSEEILRRLATAQPRSAILNLQTDLRKLTATELGRLLDALVQSGAVPSAAAKRGIGATGDGGPVSRILHLLRSEAKLTDKEAIGELRKALGARVSELGERECLEKWVVAACENLAAGEIVSVALTLAERSEEKETRVTRKKEGHS
jgi:hypothetical protein